MPHAVAKRVLWALLFAFSLNACERSGPPLPPPPAAATRATAVSGPPMALPEFTRLVEAQGPAVVNVVTTRPLPAPGPGTNGLPDDRLHDFLRRFAPDAPPPGAKGRLQGLGSGFIVGEDGLVLTNAHLVEGARSVTVRLADGKREFPGKVVGIDSRSDVALVKIEGHGLPVAKLGNSATVKPGEWVVAIGAPFGFTNTITAGVVSAVNRALPDDPVIPMIQTDVAVNPGNSGGPLINTAGEVVGINTKIYSGTGGYMGVSFAIPIELALNVARQLQSQGKVTRGSLGVSVQPMTDKLAQAFRLGDPAGVLVSGVKAGSPAAQSGLKTGDVILEYEGEAIDDAARLPQLVAGTPPGSMVKIVIWRDGARSALRTKIGESPSEPAAEAPREDADQFNLVVSEAPPPLRQELGIDYGVLVQAVEGADDTPLRPGDVIVAVNQSTFSSEAEFGRLLADHKSGETVALLLRRGAGAAYVAVKMPDGGVGRVG